MRAHIRVRWGWQWRVRMEAGRGVIGVEIYRPSHRGSQDKMRRDAAEVNRVHGSYPLALLRMGRRRRVEEDMRG